MTSPTKETKQQSFPDFGLNYSTPPKSDISKCPCIVARHYVVKVSSRRGTTLLCYTCNKWLGKKYESNDR